MLLKIGLWELEWIHPVMNCLACVSAINTSQLIPDDHGSSSKHVGGHRLLYYYSVQITCVHLFVAFTFVYVHNFYCSNICESLRMIMQLFRKCPYHPMLYLAQSSLCIFMAQVVQQVPKFNIVWYGHGQMFAYLHDVIQSFTPFPSRTYNQWCLHHTFTLQKWNCIFIPTPHKCSVVDLLTRQVQTWYRYHWY